MAAYNLATGGYPQTQTAGIATADTITLPGGFATVSVLNQDPTSTLSVRADGTVAVSDAAGTYPVPPKTQVTIPIVAKADGTFNTVSLISPAAAKYTIFPNLKGTSVLGL